MLNNGNTGRTGIDGIFRVALRMNPTQLAVARSMGVKGIGSKERNKVYGESWNETG